MLIRDSQHFLPRTVNRILDDVNWWDGVRHGNSVVKCELLHRWLNWTWNRKRRNRQRCATQLREQVIWDLIYVERFESTLASKAFPQVSHLNLSESITAQWSSRPIWSWLESSDFVLIDFHKFASIFLRVKFRPPPRSLLSIQLWIRRYSRLLPMKINIFLLGKV